MDKPSKALTAFLGPVLILILLGIAVAIGAICEFASPAAILSIVTGLGWIFGLRSRKTWLKALAANAGGYPGSAIENVSMFLAN
jgi:hypothetical protein